MIGRGRFELFVILSLLVFPGCKPQPACFQLNFKKNENAETCAGKQLSVDQLLPHSTDCVSKDDWLNGNEKIESILRNTYTKAEDTKKDIQKLAEDIKTLFAGIGEEVGKSTCFKNLADRLTASQSQSQRSDIWNCKNFHRNRVRNALMYRMRKNFCLHLIPRPSMSNSVSNAPDYATCLAGVKSLQNEKFTASSFDVNHPPYNAKLDHISAGWAAKSNSEAEEHWIQVDLESKKKITGVVIQGPSQGHDQNYVTSFKVKYGDSATELQYILDPINCHIKVFAGNYDTTTRQSHRFPVPVDGRYFRIYATTFRTRPQLHFDFFTC